MADSSEELRPAKRVKLDADGVLPSPPASGDTMKEIEVGITSYINESRPSLHGVLKKRYTDFLVNEVLPDGTVAHLREITDNSRREVDNKASVQVSNGLTDTKAPLPGGVEIESETAKDDGTTSQVSGSQPKAIDSSEKVTPPEEGQISGEDRAKLVAYFSEETVQGLTALYEAILRAPNKKSRDHPTVRSPFTSDRSLRSQIHQDIRRIFGGKIDSSTDNEGILVLTATNPKNQHGRAPQRSGDRGTHNKLTWEDRGGEYLHFNLYKENKDTMEVLSYMLRQLKVNAKTFQFAGTKDRRAATVQRISGYRIDAGRLASLNRTLKFAAIGDFKYEKQGLELGDLTGNEFVITLRDCRIGQDGTSDKTSPTAQDSVSTTQAYISQALHSLHDNGFLNYYGLQRFGTFAQRTDVVGVKILQGNYQAAVETILHYSSTALEAAQSNQDDSTFLVGQDDRARAEALHVWQTTGKWQKSLDILPRRFSAETSIIRQLGRMRNDYLGALMSIQRNLRLMYVHAYQSLVWNLAVGERWRLYGSKVVEGDLILIHEHKTLEPTAQGPNPSHNIDADGEIIIQPSSDDRATDREDRFERARPLSAAEATSGAFTIFDIVLPLPGFDVEYPSNAVGEWYKTFMASDVGGGLDPMNMRRKQKDFSLSGGYRKVVARIGQDFDVQVHTYDDSDGDKQFVKTDLETLKESGGETLQDHSQKIERTEENGNVLDKAHKLAAVLKFQLGSSQYATVALRELSRGGVQAYKTEFMGGR